MSDSDCEIVAISPPRPARIEHLSDSDDGDIVCIEESFVSTSQTYKASTDNATLTKEYVPLERKRSAKSIQLNDDEEVGLNPKKKRTKEQIQEEKLEKERVKEERKKAREDAKMEKEKEKQRKKIEREATSSVKTKSEQYIFCHVGGAVFDTINDLHIKAKMLFLDRNIEKQLIREEDLDMRIEWRRKHVEVTEENNSIGRMEYMSSLPTFAVVVHGNVLSQLIKSRQLDGWVLDQKNKYPLFNSQMIIVCFGALDVNNKILNDLSLNLYSTFKCQIKQVKLVDEMALFMAQILRGLSKTVRSMEHPHSQDKLIIDVEKGVRDAEKSLLIKDWWDKMLAAICKTSDAQRRAVLKVIPNPMEASKKFNKIGYADAIKEISEIVAENGRRVGPAFAHRLYMLLTDTTGHQVIST